MTSKSPTPRDLDPNYVDPNTTQNESAKDSRPEDPEEDMIVHRVPVVVDGVQTFKEYGPMPVSKFNQWLIDFESGKVSE